MGIWIAATVILLAVILFLSVHVTSVTVTGSKRYTAEQLDGILFPERWDKNSIYLYFKDRFRPHRQIPFVEDYKLVFHGPTRLEVIVYEKDIVGYVSNMSSYMYFDRDGIVVESSSSKLEGVPLDHRPAVRPADPAAAACGRPDRVPGHLEPDPAAVAAPAERGPHRVQFHKKRRCIWGDGGCLWG